MPVQIRTLRQLDAIHRSSSSSFPPATGAGGAEPRRSRIIRIRCAAGNHSASDGRVSTNETSGAYRTATEVQPTNHRRDAKKLPECYQMLPCFGSIGDGVCGHAFREKSRNPRSETG